MQFLPFAFLAFLLSSCVHPLNLVKTEYPTAFRASTGMAVYETEAYRWVATAEGPVDLTNAWVTSGVMTDDSLAADCSDIAGLKIGRNAWIRKSFVRGSSYIGTLARVYDSEFFGGLDVGKELQSHNTRFHQEVVVGGPITAHSSVFEDTIQATTSLICLTGTSTQSIWVRNEGPYYDVQVVRLAQGTVVDGDIIFDSCRGRVIMDCRSRITGSIRGGHVIEPFESDKFD